MNFENKVVLITGATGGLGKVAAREMAARGAKLALLSRNLDHLNALVDELSLNRNHTLVYSADLTDPIAVDEAAEAIMKRFTRLDVILHLVGGWVGGVSVSDLDPGDVAQMINQHVWTTFHVAQKFIPHLLANHWGRFMVVSAPTVTSPRPKGAPYAIGKAAQQALVLTLAQELKGTGVTANILSVKAIDASHARENDPSPRNADWATPEEIVAAMFYLCSEETQLVNGAIIPIFGGGK